MKMRYFVLALVFATISFSAFSQQNTIISNTQSTNSLFFNPALYYKCNFIKLPIISFSSAGIHHTGFAYSDVFSPYKNGYQINFDRLISLSGNYNYLILNAWSNIFAIGLKLKNDYLSVGLNARIKAIAGYPRDLLKLSHGNSPAYNNENLNLMPYLNSVAYTELYGSYSIELINHDRIGVRLRLLHGSAQASITNSFAQIITDPDSYDLDLSMRLRSYLSAPVSIQFDTNSLPVSAQFMQDQLKSLILNNNWGLAFDFGYIHKINSKSKIYAAVNNLGIIFWNTNTTKYYGEGAYTFTGLYLNGKDLVKNADSTLNAAIAQLKDTLQSSLFLGNDKDSYISGIDPLQIIVMYKHDLSDIFSIDLLTNTYFYNSAIHSQFSAFVQAHLFNSSVNLTTGISYLDRYFKNMPMSLDLKLLPIEFFISTDNLLAYFSPRTTRNITLSFGITYLFNCENHRKKIHYTTKAQKQLGIPSDACEAYKF